MKGRRAYSKNSDLPDRARIRFDTLRCIKLAEYRQQRTVQSQQGQQEVVEMKAHVSPEGMARRSGPEHLCPSGG